MGQIRKSSSVIINMKVNYIPPELSASTDCANKCNNIVVGTITSGDKSAISITSQYLAGTSYIFTITVEFGKPYIAAFTLHVGINPDLMKYFGAIPVESYDIAIQPSYLSSVVDSEALA